MKIVKIAKRPASYVSGLYATRRDAASLPYAEQKAWFCADFFGPVDIWETYLRQAGYDAVDYILGIPGLEGAWWREHASGAIPDSRAVAIAQLRHERPDIVVLEAIQSFTAAELAEIRDKVPSVRAIIGNTGTDIRSNPTLREVDGVVTCMIEFAAEIGAQGKPGFYLPWWFDKRILAHLDQPRVVREELVFLGNVVPGAHQHEYRQQILEALARRYPLSVYSDLDRDALKAWSRFGQLYGAWALGRAATRLGLPLERLPAGPQLKTAAAWKTQAPRLGYSGVLARLARPSVYGVAMFQALRRGRMTINAHIGIAGPYAANMRLFEATGAGTCLVTDHKSNLGDYFGDDEVVSFKSAPEAVEKVGWLLANPREADAIAARGHARTLSDHGFERRVPILAQVFDAVLGRRLQHAV